MSWTVWAARVGAGLAFICAPQHDAAAERLALVIGNDAYLNLTKLERAVGDARAMKDALEKLRFKVTLVENADFKTFTTAIVHFTAKVRKDDEVVIHYSGHGVAIGGQNFLVPVDSEDPQPGMEEQVRQLSRDAGQLIDSVRAKQPRYVFAIIDACRNNPFKGATRNIAAERGLKLLEPKTGAYVLYSAGEGQTALDRLGDAKKDPVTTSVFTRVLLKHIATPNLTLYRIAKNVQAEVEDSADTVNHKQSPAYSEQGREEPVLNPVKVEPLAVIRPADKAYEEAVQNGTDEGFKRFALLFPADPRTARISADLAKREDEAAFFAAVATGEAAPLEAYKKRPGARRVAEADALLARFRPPSPPSGCDDVVVLVRLNAKDESQCVKPGSGRGFKDCPECPEMVVVPAGSFMMGAPEDEPESWSGEKPQHEVKIPRAFAVGKYEISFDEWDACVKDKGCNGYRPSDGNWGRGRFPVINVSWDNAQTYVSWISKKTGKTYRLLSEAEWEYAARAGTKTPFWWGKTITTKQANYNGNYVYDNGAEGEYRKKTMPVNSFEANPWGLFQVHGNVWEWVEDCWTDNYVSKTDDLKQTGASFKMEGCKLRVVRGGSWSIIPWYLRSADRDGNVPEYSDGYLGFRLARTL